MKKVLILVGVLGILSCGKDDGLRPAFEMVYDNFRFDIPAGLNTIDAHFFVLRDIPTNKDFFFGSTPDEEVVTIVPAFARLTAIGGGVDYDFLFEVSVRICETGTNTCIREIFYREEVPINIGSQLDLIPNDIDVKGILTSEEYTIEVVLKQLRNTSPISFQTRLDFGFEARVE